MPQGLVGYTEQQAFQLPPSLGGLVIQAGNSGVAGSGVPPRVACSLPPKSKGKGFAFGRCR